MINSKERGSMQQNVTAREWLLQNNGKFESRTELLRACQKATGKCQSTVNDALLKIERKVNESVAKNATTTTEKKRTLQDFRKTFDIALKIREGVKKFLSGDRYLPDAEFREMCGVHIAQWRRYADDDEFNKNHYKFAGQILWANENTMRQMKKIAGIPEGN